MSGLSERELLEDVAAIEEENDDASDLIPFEQRVERLRRAALRPSPQCNLTRRATTRRATPASASREAQR